MTIENIQNFLNGEDLVLFNKLIENSFVTKNQVIQIAYNCFDLHLKNPEQTNRSQAKKMLITLSVLLNSNIKETDPKGYDNAIKRLMKKEGRNISKEILAHNYLTKLFNNYLVLPLFSEGPDGIIELEKENIPVEIKTRSPEILDNLNNIFEALCSNLPNPKTELITCKLTIEKFNRSFDKKSLFEESHDLVNMLNKLKSENIPERPNSLCGRRKSKNIEYLIEISKTLTEPGFQVFMDKEFVDNCLMFNGSFWNTNQQFHGGLCVNISLSDSAKKILAQKIINDCIKQGKNIPSEPRIIVINTDTLTNPHLIDFFKKVASEYTFKKKGTLILGVKEIFDDCHSLMVGTIFSKGEIIIERLKNSFKIEM